MGSKEPEINREIYGHASSRLIKNLKSNGVSAKDVHKVVLTQLHFDHSGGSTSLDREGKLIPTFPKAKYLVQKSAWDEAFNQDERLLPAYGHPVDHLNILQERDMVEFLDGNTEVSPGVHCEMIDGYSQGHQIVKVNAGSERIVYLSELIPAPSHLPLAYITAYDRYPDQTLEIKRRIIAQCEKEGWLMVFAHGYKEYAGYIKRNNQALNLEPINI
ncbi:MAG: MBL fold metallo-hydrolase [Chloroflexota bacterium]|nr:MBL fold metallo-hydrolase [Chloroflexota bacterium]